jgi:hypothetical protein
MISYDSPNQASPSRQNIGIAMIVQECLEDETLRKKRVGIGIVNR